MQASSYMFLLAPLSISLAILQHVCQPDYDILSGIFSGLQSMPSTTRPDLQRLMPSTELRCCQHQLSPAPHGCAGRRCWRARAPCRCDARRHGDRSPAGAHRCSASPAPAVQRVLALIVVPAQRKQVGARGGVPRRFCSSVVLLALMWHSSAPHDSQDICDCATCCRPLCVSMVTSDVLQE